MSERLINVRVRPARVTVLINKLSDRQGLRTVFEFYSRIWGRVFNQIFPVEAGNCDALTRFRLENSRPDFVYGIDVNDAYWRNEILDICQPRGYGALTDEFVKNLRSGSDENYVPVDLAISLHRDHKKIGKAHREKIVAVNATQQSSLNLFFSAMHGIPYAKVGQDFVEYTQDVTSNDLIDIVYSARDFVHHRWLTWCDMTGYQLQAMTPGIFLGFHPEPPTIVLVKEEVVDLPLFWNLRTTSDIGRSMWIIPLPYRKEYDAKLFVVIKEWLDRLSQAGLRSTYCRVISESATDSEGQQFAVRLEQELKETGYEAVDFDRPFNRLPVVIPIEHAATVACDLSARRLKFQPPAPKCFSDVVGRFSWFVDIESDRKTHRSVADLHMPPGRVASALLNAPGPSGMMMTRIPQVGDGPSEINVRIDGRGEAIDLFLPTSAELFEETFRFYGYEIEKDEKRSSYLPVIKRFGGLYAAAEDFSEIKRRILSCIISTRTMDEIRGHCKLNNDSLKSVNDSLFLEMMKSHNPILARIIDARHERFNRGKRPKDHQLESLLEHWVDKKIAKRSWNFGQCSYCMQRIVLPDLTSASRQGCPMCGNRFQIRDKIRPTYSLDFPVAHAISEGVIPVALTARFLRNLTRRGFLWLPGLKYKKQEIKGDADLVACCDGHIVLCECKLMEFSRTPRVEEKKAGGEATDSEHQNDRVWNEIVHQFVRLSDVAVACNASFIVLSAFVDEFPVSVTEAISIRLADRIPYLLLTKSDLESGFRKSASSSGATRLEIGDIVPAKFPEVSRRKEDGKKREISGVQNF